MTQDKQSAREYAKSARAAILPPERALLSARAAGRLTTLSECMSAKLILGYLSTAEEIDPAPALKTMSDLGVTVVYPRIAGPGSLTLHELRSDDDVEDGPFGIRQPTLAAPNVDPALVDVVVVPGVAFDSSGTRLGYGGGYYDRLLPRMPAALLVGLAFEAQLLGAIPCEGHDVHMDVIVTPEQVLRP